VGTGKTTLCRVLIERLGPATDVAFLFNPSRSGMELLQSIAEELGLEVEGLSRRALHAQLNQFLLARKAAGRRVLLIIDEAQNLSQSTLEQVRLLSNLETSSEKLIQILLLGQPELDEKLDSHELRQLRQRISVRWTLESLPSRDTRRYVQWRLRVAAGTRRDVFSPAALRQVQRDTHGTPRLINVLCDRAMLLGYAEREKTISARTVREAAREVAFDAGSGFARASFRWAAAVAVVVCAVGVGLMGWRWHTAPQDATSLPSVETKPVALGGENAAATVRSPRLSEGAEP